MIKSPLRYPGGKSKAIDPISKLIPNFKEFREPFVGGGSVFIYLKQKFSSKTFWINDIYTNLYHFWSECKENPNKLIESILEFRSKYPDGKELHRFLLANINSFDKIKKAAAFFIFNRITFSGTTESGGFSQAAFHKRFTESSIERVKALSKILINTRITNLDYEEVISNAGDDVFLFLDPPYYSATKSALYGKNGNLHKTFDHERFANVIKQTKHKWLITYDDSKYIRNLFSFANIKTWDLTYGMRNVSKDSNQIGKELFISNYDFKAKEVKNYSLFELKNSIVS
ncbi:MAG TPA: DNA adenine methylase [Ignavibacteriaceae bacterium]|jgi:DNA adenine methylase|nr:MAG: Modification methylase DpnIIA [Ignavibacteria bacterium ADurb.Bin266]OQY74361.1 MAG: modification methylase [Ignavibacteriales bacterium UTCHB2]HQF42163.1 DNA adenine methylase [Ignavibacteriaceae bacterium]HQI40930.1 DNA adenine methylase [Ignavibacteriaceae bacterium]HQJ45454.1 DNA adenine methylase [Ignavibacteriaceae bacterium]